MTTSSAFLNSLAYGQSSIWRAEQLPLIMPKIVLKISGLTTSQVILISAIPWLAAMPMMIVNAWHSDSRGERRHVQRQAQVGQRRGDRRRVGE